MILVFILSATAGIVCLAVGIDIGSQVWAETRARREAEKARAQEEEARVERAKDIILTGLRLKMARANQTTIELKVVTAPKKPAHGRHRLVAA